MALGIRAEDVCAALAPLLGVRYVTTTPLCEHAAQVMRDYVPGRMTLAEVQSELKYAIFGDLYDSLGQGMLLQLENGVRLRLRLKDVDTLTDEALGVLLDSLAERGMSLYELRDFAMQSGLLSAMRVLLQRFGDGMVPMERAMFVRIIRENFPPDRYQAWLAE